MTKLTVTLKVFTFLFPVYSFDKNVFSKLDLTLEITKLEINLVRVHQIII